MLQPLVSQEYVSQSFNITSYDAKYNIPIKIIEDQDGFLWYTTHNGLVHELGTHTFFYSLKTAPDEIIDIKNYTSLYEDGSGNIWVLSDTDIRKFNKRTQKVVSYKLTNPENQSLLIPNSVTQLANGNIYFGTQLGYIVELSASNDQLIYHNTQSQYSYEFSTKIIGSRDNTLIAKSNNQIHSFIPKK
ncbi:MAG: hypothetical protein P8L72_02225 [Flavobacteriaceae bacterium]|nr:hypothetical protein [Flavobacteriaceae bacterium]MDG2314189.1 hypothetical protein [Flavobacteriaceae bacterium]